MNSARSDNEQKREELSIFQLMQAFPNNLAAELWFERLRWPDGDRSCPNCASHSIIEISSRKPTPFRCRECRFRFSVRKNSIMEGTNLGLQKWVFGIYMLATNPKGIASTTVHKELKLTQKTAWFLMQRIREGFADVYGQPINLLNGEKMSGTVEVDEAYIGGIKRFMNAKRRARAPQGSGAVGKACVVGIKNRDTGQIMASVVLDNGKKTLQGFVHETVEDGTAVYTDEHTSYRGMEMHGFVKHGEYQYVNGQIHVNGMENFWTNLKRGYRGVHHSMSHKHLQRYLNEFVGRFNLRQLPTLERMAIIATGLFGKRLTRADLVSGRKSTQVG